MKNLKTQFAALLLSLALLSVLLLTAARPAQAQTEAVFYNFTGGNDGGSPDGGVVSDGVGNFYGTTSFGGDFGAGTVFELSPNGAGGWVETVLYNFIGGADGAYPASPLIFDSAGNLYGTAAQGGANTCGDVFELSPGTSWTETVLYSFACGSDGAYPAAGVIMDTAGNLYGTTAYGPPILSTVFELSQSGGVWTEQVIYRFTCDGAGLTMNPAGDIFGVGDTEVFELSPNGGGDWHLTILHTFAAPPKDGSLPTKDGSLPRGTPVLDSAGNVYGTTSQGGAKGYGIVYKLTLGTNGQWKEKILHTFPTDSTDGAFPDGIVLNSAGAIFGNTRGGGNDNGGTVYELSPLASGAYKEKSLWRFNVLDGNGPSGKVILDNAGNLYGTTAGGGAINGDEGVVYEVNPSPAATTTTLSSSLNPSIVAESVTFTAVVSSGAGAPPDGEIVSFKKGATVLGTGMLTAGSASFAISTLPVGASSITAVYGGDFNFEGNTSAAFSQVVQKAPTATSVASSVNPSVFGQSVTLTATVTAVAPGSGTPTGTVHFYDGTTLLGSHALTSGLATFATTKLATGTDSVTAVYVASADYNTSTSSALSEVVDQASTKTTIATSKNPSTSGATVTFTATLAAVSPGAGTPTGTVTFMDSATVLGTGTLTSKKATFATASLAEGTHSITAVYSGDSNFNGSTSTALSQKVNP
jgi:uncharacterized repeat protein (TIGR03803 family)